MLRIFKIGGNVLDDEEEKKAFLKNFSTLEGPKILVHGGGKIASEIGKKLGIVPNMHEGRRITDAETLDLVVQVYGGLINKGIVAQLQALGCNALGLSGADGNLMPAQKRPVKSIDYGWVGDVQHNKIATSLLEHLLERGFVPVIAPLSHDGEGHLLNTNADTIASSIAMAMARNYPVSLVYIFEQQGVMRDLNDPNSLLPYLNRTMAQKLTDEGIIEGGMIPKIQTALDCVEAGVKEVRIVNSKEFTNGSAGTCISV